jgi:hypothetical protein
MFAHGETVQILTAGTTTDPYSGEAKPTWATSTSVIVEGVGVEPRPSPEPVQDARNAITSGYTLYLPAATTITAANRVTVRGGTYDVLGEPASWLNPFTGWAPGVIVQLQKTEG